MGAAYPAYETVLVVVSGEGRIVSVEDDDALLPIEATGDDGDWRPLEALGLRCGGRLLTGFELRRRMEPRGFWRGEVTTGMGPGGRGRRWRVVASVLRGLGDPGEGLMLLALEAEPERLFPGMAAGVLAELERAGGEPGVDGVLRAAVLGLGAGHGWILREGGGGPVAEFTAGDYGPGPLSEGGWSPERMGPFLLTRGALEGGRVRSFTLPPLTGGDPLGRSYFLMAWLGDGEEGRGWRMVLERRQDKGAWTEEERQFLEQASGLLGLLLEGEEGRRRRGREEMGLESLLASMEVAALVVDQRSGRDEVWLASPGLCRLLGWRREEVEGRSFEEALRRLLALHGEAAGGAQEGIYRLFLQDGQLRRTEEVRLWLGGEARTFERVSRPAVDGAGQVFGRMFLFRDLTDERRLARESVHSQKMQSVRAMAAGMAERFGRLLDDLGSLSNLFEGDPDGDREVLAVCLREICAQARQSAEMTDGLLLISRLPEARLEALDLNDLVGGAEGRLRELLPAGVKLELELCGERTGGLRVESEGGLMLQALRSLVRNAGEAFTAGRRGGIVRVSTGLDLEGRRGRGGGGYATLEVEDNGEGVSEDLLGRIFEPFYTTRGHEQHSGLGLFLVYAIVKQHGGFIDVNSVAGVGTQIRMLLPLAEDAAGRDRAGGIPRTVLLVEPGDELRELCGRILLENGVVALAARSGQEAIETLERTPETPGAALLNLTLPDMGGPECLARLRAASPGLPVILTSGHSLEEADRMRDLLASGSVVFLPKPYSRETLIATLRKVAER